MTTSTSAPRPRAGLALGVAVAAALLIGACGSGSTPPAGATAPAPTTPATASGVIARDMWVKTAKSGMSAAFGTLTNTTNADITIVSAAATVSARVELHEVAGVDGEMVMRPKESGFVIPAGGTHELKPGGDHLMLMDVTTPVRPGDEVTFTLTFADGTTAQFTAVGKDFAGGNENYQPGPKATADPSTHTGG